MIGHKNNRTKGTNNAPIPEDNEQYCFRMPLKLEVHKRYWTTRCSVFLVVVHAWFITMSISIALQDMERPQNLKECMELNWKFQRGGSHKTNLFWGGMDIFWNGTFFVILSFKCCTYYSRPNTDSPSSLHRDGFWWSLHYVVRVVQNNVLNEINITVLMCLTCQ